MLKKFNAVLAIVVAFIAVLHICTCDYSMIANYWSDLFLLASFGLIISVILHGIIGLINFFNIKNITIFQYPKQNSSVVNQIISAICLIILAIVHMVIFIIIVKAISTSGQILVGQYIAMLIVNLLLFAALVVHVSISFKKALITLGIATSQRSIRICFWSVLMLFTILCFISYVLIAQCYFSYVG